MALYILYLLYCIILYSFVVYMLCTDVEKCDLAGTRVVSEVKFGFHFFFYFPTARTDRTLENSAHSIQ